MTTIIVALIGLAALALLGALSYGIRMAEIREEKEDRERRLMEYTIHKDPLLLESDLERVERVDAERAIKIEEARVEASIRRAEAVETITQRSMLAMEEAPTQLTKQEVRFALREALAALGEDP